MIQVNPCLWTLMVTSCLCCLCGCGGGGSSSSPSPSPLDQSQTLSNLRSLNIGLMEYVQDFDEQFPTATTSQMLKSQLMPYTHDSSVFVDPNTNIPFQYNVSLIGTHTNQYYDYSTIVTLYDNNPPVVGARPLALLDGKVELVTDAQWQTLKTSSQIP